MLTRSPARVRATQAVRAANPAPAALAAITLVLLASCATPSTPSVDVATSTSRSAPESQTQTLSKPTNTPTAPKTTEPAPPQVTGATSRVLFTGNIFWGRYIDDWSQASDLGTAYPFSRLEEFGREDWDAWIAGLECPTVPDLDLTSAEQERTLAFNCPPEYLEEAAKFFTAVSLGNNHTDNQGAEGFDETKRQLDKAGIQHFGHYDPTALEEVCGVVLLPAKILHDDATSSLGRLPLALCAHHGVFQIPPADSLELIDKYSKVLPVIAMPHMGAEYKATPDQIKTDTYRAMIDLGADMVIGDHPHWVQTAEEYKDKLIVYSMGNFMFDQQYNTEVTRSATVDVDITVGSSPDLAGWLEIAPVCADGLDACVAAAEERGLNRLDLEYSVSIIGSRNDERLTHPANKAEQADIEARLGWDKLAKRFG
jgi:poly-gamma-glutamate synthesis protein (capsule biosynthesis protein)